MATSIDVRPRPSALDGCWQTWAERDAPATIRSEMELGGFTKVRARTTAAAWLVDATVTLEASLYDVFMQWFRVTCVNGVFPTYAKRPDGTEVVVRFTAPPVIEWPTADNGAFRVTATFEQMPAWAGL